MTEINYRDALNQVLIETLDGDPSSFIIGEDIGPYGGTYAVTRGLTERFGPERIKDSPLAESVIVGAGIGAAMGGMRPIVEIMTINFSLLAMDQIVNHAAKIRYMSGGQITVPLIIRTVTGGGAQLAATHSQSFEGWYASVPGLTVVAPATAYDAMGLFRSCRELPDPVMFVENALLYSLKSDIPDDYYTVPIGLADIKRSGDDVTIIAYSRMVHVALEAASALASEGIDAEVVDLRTLRPLDIDTVIASVKKTHRALVVEETWKTGGFAGEISSLIHEQAFDYLDAPVQRVAGEEVPAPYASVLEDLAFPDAKRVIENVRSLLSS